MKDTIIKYRRCPHCGIDGGHQQKVSKKTGVFRIKELYGTVWILQCMKCSRIFRKLVVGADLLGKDMSPTERSAFKDDKLHYKLNRQVNAYYNKTKSQEVKNGKKI